MEFLDSEDPKTADILSNYRPAVTIEVRYTPGVYDKADFTTVLTWAPEISQAERLKMPLHGMVACLLSASKAIEVSLHTVRDSILARGLAGDPPKLADMPILAHTAKVPGKGAN